MHRRIPTPDDFAAYATMETAKARYQVGRKSIDKLAQAAGARVTIGSCVRYNLKRMDQFLDDQKGGKES